MSGYVEVPCKKCGEKKLVCSDSYHTERGFVAKYICENCKTKQNIYAK